MSVYDKFPTTGIKVLAAIVIMLSTIVGAKAPEFLPLTVPLGIFALFGMIVAVLFEHKKGTNIEE